MGGRYGAPLLIVTTPAGMPSRRLPRDSLTLQVNFVHLTLLTQYYPPEVGAPQARLSELAAHFIRCGHSVTVLTAMPNYPKGKIHFGYGGFIRREQRQGADVVRAFIYPTRTAKLVPRLLNYFSFVISSSIVGSILLRRADYLLVESPPLFLGLAGAWLSRLKRARMVFNVSDLWPESAVRLGVLRPQGATFRLAAQLESFCYNRAWLITGQSKSILAHIKERFPGRPMFHLSNGVDTRIFCGDSNSTAARAAFNADGILVVLYAGLHGLAQGLDQVLHAADALRDDLRLRFVLIGDGPEKESLLELARARELKNVTFFEPRPASEIPSWLAAADIVVVPLKMYIPGAVPSKLYEAMASARPVVLVAKGEAADIVTEHAAGIVVDPGDVNGLVKALRLLGDQPSLRRSLGRNGRCAAERYFDRSKIATRFIKHLEANL
jgi:colanic acid biosynthesis glycosyl transferase WcaI